VEHASLSGRAELETQPRDLASYDASRSDGNDEYDLFDLPAPSRTSSQSLREFPAEGASFPQGNRSGAQRDSRPDDTETYDDASWSGDEDAHQESFSDNFDDAVDVQPAASRGDDILHQGQRIDSAALNRLHNDGEDSEANHMESLVSASPVCSPY